MFNSFKLCLTHFSREGDAPLLPPSYAPGYYARLRHEAMSATRTWITGTFRCVDVAGIYSRIVCPCSLLTGCTHGHPQVGKTGISPPGIWDKVPKISKEFEVSSYVPINSFNCCDDTLFVGMTLTLRKNQVHCSGVMQ